MLYSNDSLSKNSYYLSRSQSKQLFITGSYYDSKNKIQSYKTDIRLESMNDIENGCYVVIFTHECLWGKRLKEIAQN